MILIAYLIIVKILPLPPEKELRKILHEAPILGESGFVAKLRCIYRRVILKFSRDNEKLQQALDDEELRKALAAIANNPNFQKMVLDGKSFFEIKEEGRKLLTKELTK